MAHIQSLVQVLQQHVPLQLKFHFDKAQMTGYKLIAKRVPRIKTKHQGSQIVRYAMINEDLASMLGANQC
jgi:hypothetical protein